MTDPDDLYDRTPPAVVALVAVFAVAMIGVVWTGAVVVIDLLLMWWAQ